jgi:hypothetical protein
MVQMRTGRIGLSGFLARIGVHENAQCGCDEGIQTPKHVRLECDFYVDTREEMLNRIGDKLGPGRLDYATLVSEPKVARHVADFMLKTGLPQQFKAIEFSNGG